MLARKYYLSVPSLLSDVDEDDDGSTDDEHQHERKRPRVAVMDTLAGESGCSCMCF